MSDLTKAIERIDGAQLGGESLDDEPEYRAVELVTNTARLVANPNIKQIAQRLHNQRIRGVKCYEAFPEECTCMADAEALAAVFTRQGDT